MRTNCVKDMYAEKNVKSYILKFLEVAENFLAVSLRKG